MEKPLPEQLRKWGHEADYGSSPVAKAEADLWTYMGSTEETECLLFFKFADMIERDYVPRAQYEELKKLVKGQNND